MSKKNSLPILNASDDEVNEVVNVMAHPSTSKKSRSTTAPLNVQRSTTPSLPQKKKRKQIVAPVATPPRNYSMYELFGTDSENEEDEAPSSKVKKPSHPMPSPPPPALSREYSRSNSSSRRTAARDVFGSDSDDAEIMEKTSGKKPLPIYSYFSKRVANGVSRQCDTRKDGSHFIELKVYNCAEIKNVQPMNRWRHAIITIKNMTNDDTEAWSHLTEFIKSTRKEFKDCKPDLLNGC